MYRTLWLLGISVLALLALGLLVLASASGENGTRLFNDNYHFLWNQGKWLVLAVPCMLAAMFFDYHRWRERPWMTIALYLGVLALMAAVFLFPPIKGSRRWLPLGPVRLQPSEFAKLAAVMAASVFLDRAGWRVSKWTGAAKAFVIVGGLMGLAVLEPDFGATFVIGVTALVLFLVSGMKVVHMIVLGLGCASVVGVLLSFNGNRMNRILSWVKDTFLHSAAQGAAVMSDKEKAAAEQVNAALVAIRNGGVTGVGFNKSSQKLYYLPEAHTDFIFAIGAEELGLVFSLVLLALYVTFFVCGIIIAARSPDRLGRLLAYGMSFLLFFQVLFNIGVVTKCLPTKGIALPFVSYGGTNLLTALVAVGMLFNVGRQIERQRPRPRSALSPVFEESDA